ncbi:MAG: hypothetical protein QOG04_484 [Actinomycetota bacterium]|nr:hypothetical protein [Actinomycetota bacterium]
MVSAGVLIAALFGTLLWLSMLSGPWNLASGLLDARTHLDKAEKSLTNGNIKSARYETLAAVAAARRARDGYQSGGPVMDLLRRLPKVGDALGETEHFVAAAELSAKAAQGTLAIAEGALRGPDKIIERDPEDPKNGGRFRLDRIAEIADTVRDVRSNIEGVGRELGAVDKSKLPKRFRDDVDEGIERANDTDELLANAEAGLAILPGFLGAEGPRTYLIGMQNPAEQRGTGGSILQFTRMTIDNGSPSLPKEKEASQTVYDIDKNRTLFPDVPLPEDAWYVREVPDAQRFGNANWSPDLPLSASLLLAYAQRADPTFPVMDGVIVVDPLLVRNLMPGVGRFTTRRGNVISARKSVPFLLNKAYGAFGAKDSVRKAVLRDVVQKFYEGMINPEHPTELVQGFGKSLTEKNMQVWLRDPNEQAFIEMMDWDGGLDEAKGADYFNVVEQNVGGNKLDYFEEQTYQLDVTIDGDDAIDTAKVDITNGVYLPQHRRVMGDSGGPPETGGKHGTTRPMMNLYAPGAAQFGEGTVDGTRVSLGGSSIATWTGDTPPEHLEVGKKVWTVALEIPVQDTQSFTFGYRVPDVVHTVDSRRVYRLVVQHQAKINPERLIIRIRVPEGATGIKARGFERKGDLLVLERIVKTDFELEVSWQE